jgi:hypothetical protein
MYGIDSRSDCYPWASCGTTQLFLLASAHIPCLSSLCLWSWYKSKRKRRRNLSDGSLDDIDQGMNHNKDALTTSIFDMNNNNIKNSPAFNFAGSNNNIINNNIWKSSGASNIMGQSMHGVAITSRDAAAIQAVLNENLKDESELRVQVTESDEVVLGIIETPAAAPRNLVLKRGNTSAKDLSDFKKRQHEHIEGLNLDSRLKSFAKFLINYGYSYDLFNQMKSEWDVQVAPFEYY